MLFLLLVSTLAFDPNRYFDSIRRNLGNTTTTEQAPCVAEEGKDEFTRMDCTSKSSDGYMGMEFYASKANCDAKNGRLYAQYAKKELCVEEAGKEKRQYGCKDDGTLTIQKGSCKAGLTVHKKVEDAFVSVEAAPGGCNKEDEGEYFKMSCNNGAWKKDKYADAACTGAVMMTETLLKDACIIVNTKDLFDRRRLADTDKMGFVMTCTDTNMKLARCKGSETTIDMTKNEFAGMSEVGVKAANCMKKDAGASEDVKCTGGKIAHTIYTDDKCTTLNYKNFEGDADKDCNILASFDQKNNMLFGGKCKDGLAIATLCNLKDANGKPINSNDLVAAADGTIKEKATPDGVFNKDVASGNTKTGKAAAPATKAVTGTATTNEKTAAAQPKPDLVDKNAPGVAGSASALSFVLSMIVMVLGF